MRGDSAAPGMSGGECCRGILAIEDVRPPTMPAELDAPPGREPDCRVPPGRKWVVEWLEQEEGRQQVILEVRWC